MKIKFKNAGVAIGCAGCVCRTRIKKNFEARCPASKVMNFFLNGVEEAEFEIREDE